VKQKHKKTTKTVTDKDNVSASKFGVAISKW